MDMRSLPFTATVVPKRTLGFRECAGIIKIAESTNTTIYMAKEKMTGSSKSLLSLVKLATKKEAPISITIMGDDTKGAFDAVRELLKTKD